METKVFLFLFWPELSLSSWNDSVQLNQLSELQQSLNGWALLSANAATLLQRRHTHTLNLPPKMAMLLPPPLLTSHSFLLPMLPFLRLLFPTSFFSTFPHLVFFFFIVHLCMIYVYIYKHTLTRCLWQCKDERRLARSWCFIVLIIRNQTGILSSQRKCKVHGKIMASRDGASSKPSMQNGIFCRRNLISIGFSTSLSFLVSLSGKTHQSFPLFLCLGIGGGVRINFCCVLMFFIFQFVILFNVSYEHLMPVLVNAFVSEVLI